MASTPSTTSFLSPATVAEQAGISKPTIYSWIASGLVTNKFDLDGRVIFTAKEAEAVARLAEERRAAVRALQLPKVSA